MKRYPHLVEMKNETAIKRRLQAIFRLGKFVFGSLWHVGEELWCGALPRFYANRTRRQEHPGICVGCFDGSVHATVPMLFGTSSPCSNAFTMYNFNGLQQEQDRIVYFGHFGPVQLDVLDYGSHDSEVRTHIRDNPRRPMLTDVEQNELRIFLRKALTQGVKNG